MDFKTDVRIVGTMKVFSWGEGEREGYITEYSAEIG